MSFGKVEKDIRDCKDEKDKTFYERFIGFPHMRILGIDPGLASTGWGIILHPEGGPGDVKWGTITTPATQPFPQRLSHIYHALQDVIRREKPEAVSIEQLFFATNVKTAIVVAQARGAAVLATAESGIPVFEYTPLQIKMAVSGNGRASKEQVQKMVAVLLGLREIPRPDHAADALAAALCYAHTMKTEMLYKLTAKR
jgi:crossover junction endodeoxyribonuclease RuvC